MLTDGRGNRWKAEITVIGTKHVEAKLSANVPTNQNTNADLTLAQAIIKHDRFEWIIQKAVELGCSKIIPFTSERTIPKFGSSSKLVRWQKIALEAAKQCGTSIRPEVFAPLHFSVLCKGLPHYDQKILFFEGEDKNDLNTSALAHPSTSLGASLRTIIIIGPEGGFASHEVEYAKKADAVSLSLGPLILRVETAAIAGITLVQQKLGYFDKI